MILWITKRCVIHYSLAVTRNLGGTWNVLLVLNKTILKDYSRMLSLFGNSTFQTLCSSRISNNLFKLFYWKCIKIAKINNLIMFYLLILICLSTVEMRHVTTIGWKVKSGEFDTWVLSSYIAIYYIIDEKVIISNYYVLYIHILYDMWWNRQILVRHNLKIHNL